MQCATSGSMGLHHVSSMSAIIIVVESADTSMKFAVPNMSLEAWWSMTSSCWPGPARSLNSPSRLMLGTSTVTTKSTSRRIASGPTSRWQPGNDASDSGSVAGAPKLTSTSLPDLSSTKASARPAPMVSASGWTWATTAIVAARDSNSTAPRASTRAPTRGAPASSVFGSIDTVVLRSALTVWIGLPGRLGTRADPRHIGVRGLGSGQQLVHPLHAVRRRVPGERQRRGEAHPGAGPDLGAQRTFGPVERGRRAGVIRLVVQRAPHHRVEHRRIVQVGGHLRVDDCHAVQAGILDLELDRRGDDGEDPFRQPARPGGVGHQARSFWTSS